MKSKEYIEALASLNREQQSKNLFTNITESNVRNEMSKIKRKKVK